MLFPNSSNDCLQSISDDLLPTMPDKISDPLSVAIKTMLSSKGDARINGAADFLTVATGGLSPSSINKKVDLTDLINDVQKTSGQKKLQKIANLVFTLFIAMDQVTVNDIPVYQTDLARIQKLQGIPNQLGTCKFIFSLITDPKAAHIFTPDQITAIASLITQSAKTPTQAIATKISNAFGVSWFCEPQPQTDLEENPPNTLDWANDFGTCGNLNDVCNKPGRECFKKSKKPKK